MRSSVSTRAMEAQRDLKTFTIAPLFHAHPDVGVALGTFLD
jgi:hypothetical protein